MKAGIRYVSTSRCNSGLSHQFEHVAECKDAAGRAVRPHRGYGDSMPSVNCRFKSCRAHPNTQPYSFFVKNHTMKKAIQVILYAGEKYENGFPPEGAREFLVWVQTQFAKIPVEFMHTARVELDANNGYDDCVYPTICITYIRPETDEEEHQRETAERRRQEAVEKQERKQFEQLKRKFEP